MAHIQRRGRDRWRARYIGPDGRERSKTFRRRVDAERFLATVEAGKLRGEWIDPRLGRRTFGEWAAQFEASRVNLERTTRAQREVALRTHILPWFGDRPLGSITEMDVRAFLGELLRSGMAPSYATKHLRILSQILKAAVRNQLVPRNPCDGVEAPGEAPVEETTFLTPEELNRLVEAFEARFRPMVLLAGYRGLRFGELGGLRPRRVNLLLGKLEVVEALKEVAGQLYFGPPKHRRLRTIALPPFLVEALQHHLEAHPPRNDLLFTNPDGSMLRRSNFDRRVWAPAVRTAGIDPRLTFHGLRHTAVSILIAQGASIVELAAIMGWSRSTAVAMAMRYGHLFAVRDEHLTDAIERVYRGAGRPGDGLSSPEGIRKDERWGQ